MLGQCFDNKLDLKQFLPKLLVAFGENEKEGKFLAITSKYGCNFDTQIESTFSQGFFLRNFLTPLKYNPRLMFRLFKPTYNY